MANYSWSRGAALCRPLGYRWYQGSISEADYQRIICESSAGCLFGCLMTCGSNCFAVVEAVLCQLLVGTKKRPAMRRRKLERESFRFEGTSRTVRAIGGLLGKRRTDRRSFYLLSFQSPAFNLEVATWKVFSHRNDASATVSTHSSLHRYL